MTKDDVVALHIDLAECFHRNGWPSDFTAKHKQRAQALLDGADPTAEELTGDRLTVMCETCK